MAQASMSNAFLMQQSSVEISFLGYASRVNRQNNPRVSALFTEEETYA